MCIQVIKTLLCLVVALIAYVFYLQHRLTIAHIELIKLGEKIPDKEDLNSAKKSDKEQLDNTKKPDKEQLDTKHDSTIKDAINIAENKIKFLLQIGTLKKQRRTGWVNNKIPDCESIADHMYRLAMCSYCIQDPCIDINKLVHISIIHDATESICGDITPPEYSKITKKNKRILEENAIKILSEYLSFLPKNKNFLRETWYDYEFTNSAEASIIKQFDKFEMLLQAYEYESKYSICLDSFFKSVPSTYFTHNEIYDMYTVLMKWRKSHKIIQTGNTIDIIDKFTT